MHVQLYFRFVFLKDPGAIPLKCNYQGTQSSYFPGSMGVFEPNFSLTWSHPPSYKTTSDDEDRTKFTFPLSKAN